MANLKKLLLPLALVGAGFLVLRQMAGNAPVPNNLGVVDGKLAGCPNTPNCVSTQATDTAKKMQPIPYAVASTPREVLMAIADMPRHRVVTRYIDYVHVEFYSPTIGFIDDVEFYFDDEAELVHFRAAARQGRDDMGANQRRMEEIIARIYAGS